MGEAGTIPNYELFRRPRTRVIRQLNDIAVTAELAQKAVVEARRNLRGKPRSAARRFIVPTAKGDESLVARTPAEVVALLDRVAARGLFQQALVPAVATTESYLAEMLFLILRAFPKKLGADKKVDLALLVEAPDLDALLKTVIWRHIHSALFDSPTKYLEFVERTLSLPIPAPQKAAYAEVKATRDICVHNDGIVNHLYLQKAGALARAGEGQEVPLDEQYFSAAVSCLKKLVETVYKGLLKTFGKSSELGAACIWTPPVKRKVKSVHQASVGEWP